MKASVFHSFNVVVEDKALIIIAKEIIEGKFKETVLEVQRLFASGNKAAADELKKRLLGFTPSATFSGGRKAEFLTFYSQCIVLDIDNLLPDQLDAAFSKAASIPYTFLCFRSPKGNGLKIIVEVTSTLEHHETAYNQLADYYQSQLGIEIDRSGKDVTRLCFYSYDPLAHKNIAAEKFPVQIAVPATVPHAVKTSFQQPPVVPALTHESDYADSFRKAIQFTENVAAFSEGNRNNFVYRLACNCNRSALPEDEALYMILNDYNYNLKEVTAAVRSAYKHHSAEFGKFPNTPYQEAQPIQKSEPVGEVFGELLSATPYIPDELIASLPAILKSGCDAFVNKRERDLFLTGAITVLSGCISNVSGTYDHRTVYANLNCFGIAPPASGKGALTSARDLGKAYHKKLLEESTDAQRQYKVAMQQYKMDMRDGNRSAEEPPEEPAFRLLYIPANSSSAAVIKMLKSADGKGIICETEADTLSATFKQDWGGYSEMLRKAFHHEPITYNRKTNNEHTEIDAPQLSVALAGTPSQVLSLISSSEDGLFSRFIFYVFRSEMKWRDVSPNGNRVNLTDHFKQLAEEVKTMIEFLEASPTSFTLTNDQWAELNTFFSNRLDHAITFISEDFSGTLMRLGIIAFRIAMVISAIRKFEDGVMDANIICDDMDFKTALTLADVYLQHAILMFKHLPKGTGVTLEPLKQKLFDSLPSEFTRQEAIGIGKQLKIAERTVDKYLKQFTGKFLEKLTEYGKYSKIAV